MLQIDLLTIEVEPSWTADPNKVGKDLAERAEEARRRQTVPYAVAPGHTIDFPDDAKRLTAGDEITLEDLSVCNELPAGVMHRLVARRVVLGLDPEEIFAVRTGAGARYRVAPGKALLVRIPGDPHKQTIVEGAAVRPEYFSADTVEGELRIMELVSLGYVTDEDPEPPLAA